MSPYCHSKQIKRSERQRVKLLRLTRILLLQQLLLLLPFSDFLLQSKVVFVNAFTVDIQKTPPKQKNVLGRISRLDRVSSYLENPRWVLESSSSTSSLLMATRRQDEPFDDIISSEPEQQIINDNNTTRVVIVGGGVGGLALAARLATELKDNQQQPYSITILEKNDHVGGRCGSKEIQLPQGTFRHERGPSLLLLPQVYQEIFEDCGGKTMQDYGLNIRPCLPAYQAVFDDGDRIDVGFPRLNDDPQKQASNDDHDFSQLQAASRAKMNQWQADGSQQWDDYQRACRAFLDCGWPNFIREKFDLFSFPRFLTEALRDGARAWPLKPHSAVLDAFFNESAKLQALASFQDLYVGLEPYQNEKAWLGGGVLTTTAPAVFGLLSAIELQPPDEKWCGVYAPVGGFEQVTQSLTALAKDCGCTIQTGKRVTKVTSEGVWYCNIEEDSSNTESAGPTQYFEPADLVVVNADLPYATKSLVDDTKTSTTSNDTTTTYDSVPPSPPDSKEQFDWDDKYRYSSGVIAFHWSLDTALTQLRTHNVFLSAQNRRDAEKSWSVLRDSSISFDNYLLNDDSPFNFYVHRASATDPSAAPEGGDSILVLVPCPTLQRNPTMADSPLSESMDYYNSTISDQTIDAARRAVLRRMATVNKNDNGDVDDFATHILHEFVDTPATYARDYHVAAGTPFALSHGFAQLSVTRPGPFTGNVPNVMYVGASSRPGNGVPLVLVGAQLASKRAAQNLRERGLCS